MIFFRSLFFKFLIGAVLPLALIGSCKKPFQKTKVEMIYSEILEDGSVKLTAKVSAGNKYVDRAGFCYGKSSKPELDNYSSSNSNPFGTSLDSDGTFSATASEVYFESFTGYYFRPYVVVNSKVVYGDEVYLDKISKPVAAPPCTLPNNSIHIGTTTGTEYFTNITVSQGYYYEIQASSNSHNFTFKFKSKPKTGIYKTSNSEEGFDLVGISFYSGFFMGYSPVNGSSVYVHEVEKDKFEITFCNIPWKYNNSTLYMKSKLIVQ